MANTKISMDQFFHIKEKLISEETCQNLINLYIEDRELVTVDIHKVNEIDKIIKELYLGDKVSREWKSYLENIKELVDREVKSYLTNFKTVTLGNYKYSHSVFREQSEFKYTPFHYDAEFVYEKEGKDSLRNFICLIYLNENFDGGELIFPLQAKVLKPKTGMLVIFPTSYMFPHMTTPSLGNDRFLLRISYYLDMEGKLKSEGYL